jgi:hypothetical protein
MGVAVRVGCPKCRSIAALDQLGSIAGHHPGPGRRSWCTAAGLTVEEARAWVAGRLTKANVRHLIRMRDRLVQP